MAGLDPTDAGQDPPREVAGGIGLHDVLLGAVIGSQDAHRDLQRTHRPGASPGAQRGVDLRRGEGDVDRRGATRGCGLRRTFLGIEAVLWPVSPRLVVGVGQAPAGGGRLQLVGHRGRRRLELHAGQRRADDCKQDSGGDPDP